MRGGFMARLTKENHPDLASHIKSSKEGCDSQEPVNNWITHACIQENFILRPEPCKRDNASQCKRTNQVHPKCDRHGLAKSAHVTHVVGVKDFLRMASFVFCGFLVMRVLCMMVPAF